MSKEDVLNMKQALDRIPKGIGTDHDYAVLNGRLIMYQIITTSVCYVKAETEEDAEKEFHNRSDYGDIVDCDIEEFVSSTNTEQT